MVNLRQTLGGLGVFATLLIVFTYFLHDFLQWKFTERKKRCYPVGGLNFLVISIFFYKKLNVYIELFETFIILFWLPSYYKLCHWNDCVQFKFVIYYLQKSLCKSVPCGYLWICGKNGQNWQTTVTWLYSIFEI